MTEDIRLEPIEREAVRILQSGDPPCQLDIERMFNMIPRSMLKYNDDASIYVAGGASPRCRDSLFTLSIDLPYFNFAVTRYLHWVAPAHKFTTFVLRRGVIGFPHRDTRNAPLPSLVQAFTTPDWERDGLWVQDRLGTVPKSHRGKLVFGRIQPLMMPFIFNARRLLHAGYVQDSSRRQERLILVAFCTIHASVLDELIRSRLFGLGFNLPTAADCHVALHGDVPGDPPRLRPISQYEFFQLSPRAASQHDVIEVVHVHERRGSNSSSAA